MAQYMINPNETDGVRLAQALMGTNDSVYRQQMYDSMTTAQKQALQQVSPSALQNITGGQALPGNQSAATSIITGQGTVNPAASTKSIIAAKGNLGNMTVTGPNGEQINIPNYVGNQGATPTTGTSGTATPTPTPTPTSTGTGTGTTTNNSATTATTNKALGIVNQNLTNPQLGASGTYTPVNQTVGAGETLTGEGSMLEGDINVANPTNNGTATAAPAAQAGQQQSSGVATVDPSLIGNNTPQMTAAQGTVSDQSLVTAPDAGTAAQAEAAQTVLTPEALATLPQGTLSPESIAQVAQTQLTPEMMVQAAQGNLSPAALVEAINFQASEAFNAAVEQAKTDAINFPIDPRATVQEQYRQLTDFEPGEFPNWAKGAVTSAQQMMAARGISSSTMAGGAITAAVLQAALPIAQQDAKMFETMSLRTFDATQAATMLKASHIANLDIASAGFKQAAALQNAQSQLQMDLTNLNNEQQARVTNARTLVEVAMNNTGLRQQTALANAAANLSMDMKNMDRETATALQNAQNIVNTLLANTANKQQSNIFNAGEANKFSQADLDRRMQANISNANTFMNMDLTNLSNRQQEAVINTQARIQTMLSDSASINAALQFNAQSTNQTDQFFASLAANIDQFNAAQINAVSMFNTGEINKDDQFYSNLETQVATFNAEMDNIREQFNASNALVIEQSNVNYLRNINTINTAEQNRANLVNSQNILQMKSEALQAAIQLYRDSAAMNFQSSESALDRANRIALMDMQIKSAQDLQNSQQKAGLGNAIGGLVGDVVGSVVKGAIKNAQQTPGGLI